MNWTVQMYTLRDGPTEAGCGGCAAVSGGKGRNV